MSRRSLLLAYFLWAILGLIGGHRFYLGHYGWGFIYLVTGGLFGFGWLFDAFTLPGEVDAYNREWEQLNEPIPRARLVSG